MNRHVIPLFAIATALSLQPLVSASAGRVIVPASDLQAGAAPEVYKAPEDGGPRNFEVLRGVNLRQDPSTSAPVVARYAPATLLNNLGCRQAEGRVWCDVQQLGGGPRGFVAAEFIKPAVGPDGAVPMGPDDTALRAGQGDFDANGTVKCAQAAGQPMTDCAFGVARASGGYATVVVTRPDGRTRAIFFQLGRAIGADTSQADGYPDFSATRKDDITIVSVGAERYEIFDAVVLGG